MTAKEFGRTVRQRRQYRYGSKPNGFKLLCKDAGISKSVLSKVENGKTNPCLSTMNKLADALNFDIQTNV